MNKIRYFIVLVCLLCPLLAKAQGHVVSGTVSDDLGPLMGVYAVEIDGSNRIIEATVTDMNGHFSLKVRNPQDRLRFTYMGYKTEIFEIGKRAVFNVTMVENSRVLKEVVVKGQQTKVATGGLDIPEREQSFAQQTIKMEEFEGLSITSADEALQGRIAGLDIITNSGNLGSGTTMRLRGVSTIFGNAEPLIVMDGNIFETNANEDIDYSNMTDERFAELLSINPEDIESISVLKDAAATALWGSKGSNGVISIVTKRGKRGKPQFTYSLRLKGTYQPEGYKLLNGDQYTMMMKEELFNTNQNPESLPELNYDRTYAEYEQFNNNTDWRDAVKQFGLFQTHYVSLSGGGEKANYRISAGYDHQIGSIIGQQLDRFTTRMALDYFVSDRIRISSNFSLTYTDNQQNSDDLLSVAYRKMPNVAIYDEDAYGNSLGTYYRIPRFRASYSGDQDELGGQRDLVNPVASAYLAQKEDRTYNIVPQFDIQYRLLGIDQSSHQLNYNGTVYLSIYNKYADTYYPWELRSRDWTQEVTDVNTASSAFDKSFAFTTRHQLTFIPHILNEDHSVSLFFKGEMTSGTSSGQSVSSYSIPSGTITSAASGGHLNSTTTSAGHWRNANWVFQGHYAYKGRYMLDAAVRGDGSTKFGPNYRWGIFYSASGRWNISDEKWMDFSKKWLSMFAMRFSYGATGREPGSSDTYYSVYNAGGAYIGDISMRPGNVQLTDLRWEKNTQWNLGWNIGLFNDLVTADINLYRNMATDILMKNTSIPTSTGFSSLAWENGGDMLNQGYEINFQLNRVKLVGDLSATFNFTFANNRNTITKMDPIRLASINGTGINIPDNGEYMTRVQIDNPFGAIYGLRYKGVYAYSYDNYEKATAAGATCPVARDASGNVIYGAKGEPLQMYYDYNGARYAFQGGDAIYEDINHDGSIDQYDIVYLGSSLPKLTGGFGFRLHYKGWSLNAQFNYRYGNKIINKARMNAENMYGSNNQSTAVNYRWRKEGDGADGAMVLPRALYNMGYNWLGSDRFVEDGSFLRLNYLQIAYNMDARWIKRIGLSRLSLYLSGENLFCLTKYSGVDPEVSYGGYGVTADEAITPRAKSYTFGLTATF